MPREHRPRRGSLQFWPRKRARRIIARVRTWPEEKGVNVLGFACYKAGMTTVSYVNNIEGSPTFGQVVSCPVTVLDAPPLLVSGLRFYSSSVPGPIVWSRDKNIQKLLLAKLKLKKVKNDLEKIDTTKYDDVRLLVLTQPRESGVGKKTPELFELPLSGDYEEKVAFAKNMLNKEINVSDVLKPGEFVDVTAVTKGKGFSGVVKRFGVSIQGRKNNQHHRHVGAHHVERPGKLDFRTPMAGQLGFQQRTELNKLVLKIGDEPSEVNPKGGFVNYGLVKKNYVLIAGSIPGARKRLVFLKKSIRPTKKPVEVEIKSIDTSSQQGVRK